MRKMHQKHGPTGCPSLDNPVSVPNVRSVVSCRRPLNEDPNRALSHLIQTHPFHPAWVGRGCAYVQHTPAPTHAHPTSTCVCHASGYLCYLGVYRHLFWGVGHMSKFAHGMRMCWWLGYSTWVCLVLLCGVGVHGTWACVLLRCAWVRARPHTANKGVFWVVVAHGYVLTTTMPITIP